jgi:hypothetical protein
MKKNIFSVFGVLSVTFLLMGCDNAINPSTRTEKEFLEQLKIVTIKAASRLFYDSTNDGIPDNNNYIKTKDVTETGGVCTDYALEFCYIWNEELDLDIVYGECLLAAISSNGFRRIKRVTQWLPNGTFSWRELEGPNFGINSGNQESDGVLRDCKHDVIQIFSERVHFGQNDVTNHMWPIVVSSQYGTYDADPTWDDNSNSPKYYAKVTDGIVSIEEKFEGTWKHPNPESKNTTITFTETSFVYSWDSGSKNGSFTFDDTNIIFLMSDGNTWSTTYTFQTTTDLRFEQGTGCFHWYGTFNRQQ